jgi:hypothetical protein
MDFSLKHFDLSPKYSIFARVYHLINTYNQVLFGGMYALCAALL